MENPNDSRGPLSRRLAAVALVLATAGWSIERLPMFNEAISATMASYRLIGSLASVLGSVAGTWIGFGLMVTGGVLISRWCWNPTDSTTKMVIAAAVLVMAAGTILAIDSTTGMTAGGTDLPIAPDRRGLSSSCRSGKKAHVVTRHAAQASRPRDPGTPVNHLGHRRTPDRYRSSSRHRYRGICDKHGR